MRNMGDQPGPSTSKVHGNMDEEQKNHSNSDPSRNRQRHYVESEPAARASGNEMAENGDHQSGLGPQQMLNNNEAGATNSGYDGESDDSIEIIATNPSRQSSVESMLSTNMVTSERIPRATDLFVAVSVSSFPHKEEISNLCMRAVDELVALATEDAPLWQRLNDGPSETLNGLEYIRRFGFTDDSATMQELLNMIEDDADSASVANGRDTEQRKLGFEPLHIEASRATQIVSVGPMALIDLLMDFKKWSSTFSQIMSRTNLLGVWSAGAGTSSDWESQVRLDFPQMEAPINHDGTLQVMSAEFHQPTAFVPYRECQLARHCKRLNQGTWVVLNVSLESLFPYPVVNFRRRPSGCLIQATPFGGSKVTWVEHVEVNNERVHPMFGALVNSGFAFGAKRWISCITQHCDRQATLMAPPSPFCRVITEEGRQSLMKLAQRMVASFHGETCVSTSKVWIPIPRRGEEDIRFRTKRGTVCPIMSPENQVIVTTSLLLPVSPTRVFDFLRNENLRNKWDLLAQGHNVRELCHIMKGGRPDNRVSLVEVRNGNSNEREIVYMQESHTDEVGSYVVFASMDGEAITHILGGGDPEFVGILPSGFAIFPDRPPVTRERENTGTLLTITIQSIDENLGMPTENHHLSAAKIETIYNVITITSTLIGNALLLGDM